MEKTKEASPVEPSAKKALKDLEKYKKDRQRAVRKFLEFNAKLVLEYKMKIVGGLHHLFLDGVRFEVGDIEAVYTGDKDREEAQKTLDELKKLADNDIVYVSDFKVKEEKISENKKGIGLKGMLTPKS